MAKEYEIARPGSSCTKCGTAIAPGQELMAAICEAGDGFERLDYCLPCWQTQPKAPQELYGHWKTRAPAEKEKKKLLVDDEVIVDFFTRLAGEEEPAKINFRYILALVLMRKKLLVYDRMKKAPDGRDVWNLHFRGQEALIEVVDPHMDEAKIAEVSAQLSQVMEVGL